MTGTPFGTLTERRSAAVPSSTQTRPDQTTSNLRPWVVVIWSLLHCIGTVTYPTAMPCKKTQR